jgi:hypothetical protein
VSVSSTIELSRSGLWSLRWTFSTVMRKNSVTGVPEPTDKRIARLWVIGPREREDEIRMMAWDFEKYTRRQMHEVVQGHGYEGDDRKYYIVLSTGPKAAGIAAGCASRLEDFERAWSRRDRSR